MCFSAEASFAGGLIISAIGIATVTKVHKSSQLVFASIPLFFGLQQFTEGVLWLTLPNHDAVTIQKVSTYLFLIMAEVLWPMMIPLSARLSKHLDNGSYPNFIIIPTLFVKNTSSKVYA